MWSEFGQDLRYAWRWLLRERGSRVRRGLRELPRRQSGLPRAVGVDVPFEFTTLAERLSAQLAGRRFLMLVLGIFAGLALVLSAAALLSWLIEAMLFETAPTDLLTFAGVAILLCAIAWLAVLVPARRATRVDPITALRAQ